jgi:hypothetical protein
LSLDCVIISGVIIQRYYFFRKSPESGFLLQENQKPERSREVVSFACRRNSAGGR